MNKQTKYYIQKTNALIMKAAVTAVIIMVEGDSIWLVTVIWSLTALLLLYYHHHMYDNFNLICVPLISSTYLQNLPHGLSLTASRQQGRVPLSLQAVILTNFATDHHPLSLLFHSSGWNLPV